MFAGELLCFAFLGVKLWLDKRAAVQQEITSPGANMARQVKMKTNINPLLLAIPATCDVCGTTLMFVALIMVPASVYQMMRGLIVPITALFSVVFLKRKQYRHHWTGIVLIVFGVAEVGYVAITAGLLIVRTLMSIWLADVNGRVVKAIVNKDLKMFIYRVSFISL